MRPARGRRGARRCARPIRCRCMSLNPSELGVVERFAFGLVSLGTGSASMVSVPAASVLMLAFSMPPFWHRCAGRALRVSRRERASSGRWSLPAPSTSIEHAERVDAASCRSPARGRSGRRAAAERRSARCRARRCRRRARHPCSGRACRPSTPRAGHVVDRRVEVAGHDHVGRLALLGQPVEVALPCAHRALDRGDRRARRRSSGPTPFTGVATTVGDTLVLPGGPAPGADASVYSPRSGLISSAVERAL